MRMLLSIGPINIDFGMLISFGIGVIFGITLFALLYLYAVVRSFNKNLKLRKVQEEDIDEEEIKFLINDTQNEFRNKKARKEEGYGTMLTRLSKTLSADIANKFYPKSKYPFFELTIDESIALLAYISKRIDQLLDHRILRLFRGLTIAKIMQLNDTQEIIQNNVIVKQASKYSKVVKGALMAINIVNPVYWFRKAVIDNMTKIILVKLGLAIIAITGEETYKIYSKKVFTEEKEIDANVDALYEEIDRVIKEGGKDEEENPDNE